MDTATLLLGVLFCALGGGYLVYGLRQKVWLPTLCGLALGVFTWFVDGPVLTALIGIALAALPWLLRG